MVVAFIIRQYGPLNPDHATEKGIWAYRKGYLVNEGPLAVTNQKLPVWRAIVVSMMNVGKPGEGGPMTQRDSRSALLEAAWDLTIESFGLSDSTPSGRSAKILDQLKTAEIAARAGLSTGAFYNRWPTRDDFLDDFLDFALSAERYPGPGQLFEVFASSSHQSLQEMVSELAAVNVAELEASPTLFVQVHLWSLSSQRKDVAERLARLHMELRDRMVPFYDAVLAAMGREYRPPFDGPSVSALLNAVTMGFVEQRVVGGDDAAPLELLANSIMALIPSLSRRVGDQDTLDDLINGFMPASVSQ